MIAAFLVMLLAQAAPPPLGAVSAAPMPGAAERDLPAPHPPSSPAPPDCACGVPSSPRGPR